FRAEVLTHHVADDVVALGVLIQPKDRADPRARDSVAAIRGQVRVGLEHRVHAATAFFRALYRARRLDSRAGGRPQPASSLATLDNSVSSAAPSIADRKSAALA